MRSLLVGLSLVTLLVGLVGCSGGPGDVPTQRGASLSSGGTGGGGGTNGGGDSNGGGGNGGNGGNSGGGNGGDTVEPGPGGEEPAPEPAADCQLGSMCACGGSGQTGIVTSCDGEAPTCTCTEAN